MLLGHKTTNKQNETKLGSLVALVLSSTTSSLLIRLLIVNSAIIANYTKLDDARTLNNNKQTKSTKSGDGPSTHPVCLVDATCLRSQWPTEVMAEQRLVMVTPA